MTAATVALLVLLTFFVGWLIHVTGNDRAETARRLAVLRAQFGGGGGNEKAGGGAGRPQDLARDVAAIARYHEAQREHGGSWVDDGTWRDLNMDAVFREIDRTGSFAGSACLYDRLRTPEASLASVRRFDEAVTHLAADAPTRERVQLVFAFVSAYGQAAVLDMLFGRTVPPTVMRYVFPALGILNLLAVATLVGSRFAPAAVGLVLVLAIVSIAARVSYGRRGLAPIDGFRKVHGLLDVGRKLAAIEHAGLEPELGAIRAVMARLSGLARATSWLLVDTSRANELVAIFVTYVNAFFLIDLTSLTRSLALVESQRGDLRALFALVGNLDAAIAVASFRAGLRHFSRPEIDPASALLELKGATHPLIARAVPNGIRVEERGVLVTGGNMAGKSTLVRTVAVNALLAQTIYTTLTTVYRAPVLRVRTLMSASDDVQRNRSYYYAELERAKALLEPSPPASGEPIRTLVVLDELFRGTNTSERIGAGKAVLDALARAGHFVFAATHDRELVGLLAGRFDPYHFGEDVVDGDLVFPYDLRTGPSTTRNAIALMRIVGFPERVVADATGVVERIEAT